MNKFHRGKISFSTFLSPADPPNVTTLRSALRRHRFQPLSPNDPHDESAGWVDPFLSFETKEFPNCYFRDYYLFSLRSDRYHFPPSHLRPFFEEELHCFKEEHKVAFVSRYQRNEIREAAVRRARALTLPRPTITEVAWDLGENRLFLFSQAKKVKDIFLRLFEQTFGIVPQISGIADALSRIEQKEKLTSLLTKGMPLHLQTAKESNTGAPPPTPEAIPPFLGQEFLLWLYWRSSSDSYYYLEPFGIGNADLVLEEQITLASLTGDGYHETIHTPEVACHEDVRASIKAGRIPTTARIKVWRGEVEWRFTLSAFPLVMRSLRLPNAVGMDDDEETIHARLQSLREIESVMRAIFHLFLLERTNRTFLSTMRKIIGHE